MPFSVLSIFGCLLGIMGLALAVPFACALMHDTCAWAFGVPMAVSLAGACGFGLRGRGKSRPFGVRTAFFVVGGAWLFLALYGALPLYFSGAYPVFADALFESFSGFTTTGATVARDVEALPRAVLLWRAITHWLGGMGVVALAVALLPFLGIGGFRLIKAETTGPEKDKIMARTTSAAKGLWMLYCSMTFLQAGFLWLWGLSPFDAVCHAFSTVSTGGFSTRNASIGAFASPAVCWTCAVFMLAASVNFALYFQVLCGRVAEVRRDTELKAFALVVGLAAVLVVLVQAPATGSFSAALCAGVFQVASVVSTTGFMTDDYTHWHPAAQIVVFGLFFVGGCSGSTSGGVKVIRWAVLFKLLRNEFQRLLHPHAVLTIRINGQPGREAFVPRVGAFVFVYLLLVFLTAFLGACAGLPLLEAISGALSMVGNFGPAFGSLGPSGTYGDLPAWLKLWYAFAMLAGRLELYTMLILLGGTLRFLGSRLVREKRPALR